MLIRKASPVDSTRLAQLASRLWPHHTPAELEPEFATLIVSPEAACFLAFDGDEAIGPQHLAEAIQYRNTDILKG